ncbi:hypothetical protein [Natrialba taiwanensis]|uniref:Uncharacterized protein n=1 Tax=Natrialba taiwanensis DSM 12281 TaxID=1230458 RepID=L9ZY42_9EURY|nr:hypothetical protein [Natrialba taiwanensis]ELY91430.1 hypothetical protein C484_10396 [Natrialba taiwanensis DSM 12281]
MKEAIEREAEEQELSPTEYMRTILRNRKQITMEDSAKESEGDYDELADRVDELERRLNHFEESEPRDTDQPSTEYDEIIQWVRDNQPVTKRDVLDEWHSEDMMYAELTWWEQDVKPALKEAGFSHTRNIGWTGE